MGLLSDLRLCVYRADLCLDVFVTCSRYIMTKWELDGLVGYSFTRQAHHISTRENTGCIGRVRHVFGVWEVPLIEKRLHLVGI